MGEASSPVVPQQRGTPAVPARWTDALSTLLASCGPRVWDDVEAVVDHVLTGEPAVPPRLGGGRRAEHGLSGYLNARRQVIEGLRDVPPVVALRWARVRAQIRRDDPTTMAPLGDRLLESLLADIAEAFGAPENPVPLDVVVLEDLLCELGLGPAAVVVTALTPGPDATPGHPSRASLALTAMGGYDEALVRHTVSVSAALLRADPAGQVWALRLLERAGTPTLRVFADLIERLAASRDAAVRGAVRPLERRVLVDREAAGTEPATDALAER